MKYILIMTCWFIPILAQAQVKFLAPDNWAVLVAQAKKEHKLIFLDAMATWCGPCKMMDQQVYTDSKVAAYVNANFLPIKVQFDQTKNDAISVKNWYADAKLLLAKYHITAFPTSLFIDGNGQLIEKSIGYQPAEAFLTLSKKANSPEANYAAIVAKYRAGQIRGNALMSLADQAKKSQDTILADQVARRYYRFVAEQEDLSKILSPQLRGFIIDFQNIISLNDRLIHYFYTHQAQVDAKVDYRNFAQKVVDYYIDRDMITPIIKQNVVDSLHTPDWRALSDMIKKRYDAQTATRLVLTTQIDWYKGKKDWPMVVKYTIADIEFTKIDTVGLAARSKLNNLAFGVIFMHSEDPIALNKAIGYMKMILACNPTMTSWIDTYANLLYKAGRKEQAMTEEAKAIKLTKESKYPDDAAAYEQVLEKMKRNEATWNEGEE
jgi:thioredoxin-related protein